MGDISINDTGEKTVFVDKGQTVTLKQKAKTGYKFMGWYSDKKYKNKVTQIKKGTTGNKTLYAKWKKK